MKAFHFLLAALAAGAPLLRAESVTLSPSQDSDVYSYLDRPTSTIYTLGVSASGAGAPHSQRTLIQFNLTPLTIPSAQIGTAVLRLYVVATDPVYGDLSPGNVSVYSQEKAWSVSAPKVTPVTPTWSSFSPGDLEGTIPIASNSSDKWVELDITALVKAWASGAKVNNGIELMPDSETAVPALNVSFASMEVTAAGNPVGPQLVVTRAVPPAVPPVLTIAPNATGDAVTLSWPAANATGWTLQQATTLDGSWTADTTTVTITADGTAQVVHPTAGAPMCFYRFVKS